MSSSQSDNAPKPQLESLPTELIRLISETASPEAAAALSLVSKRLQAQTGENYERLGPFGSETRREFLQLFERETPLVYCPWCQLLHFPERAIPVDDNSHRHCQSSTLRIQGTFVQFPPSYHPLILYRAQNPSPATMDGAANIQDVLRVPTEVSTPPSSAYGCTQDWGSSFGPHGIFVARRRIFVVQPGPLRRIWENLCPHKNVDIRPDQLCDIDPESPFLKFVFVIGRSGATHECDPPTHDDDQCRFSHGQVHGCAQCNFDFLIEAQLNASPLQFVFTSWWHLGQGKTPEAIYQRLHNTYMREVGERSLDVGNVRRLSGLFM